MRGGDAASTLPHVSHKRRFGSEHARRELLDTQEKAKEATFITKAVCEVIWLGTNIVAGLKLKNATHYDSFLIARFEIGSRGVNVRPALITHHKDRDLFGRRLPVNNNSGSWLAIEAED